MDNDDDINEDEFGNLAKKIKGKDADKFWDQAAGKAPEGKDADGDILTYDEALDQGLIPEGDD